MTHSFLLFVIYALAVHRLTILGTEDTITEPIRDWLKGKSFGELVERDNITGNVISRTPSPKPKSLWSWLWKLTTCPWCLSMYMAAGVVTLAYFQGSWFKYVALVLAFSSIAALISEKT